MNEQCMKLQSVRARKFKAIVVSISGTFGRFLLELRSR
jgi:hypothetical protein